jgi:deazaflavin-dependent oxidoreductase (nitroreductase family)
VSWLAPYVDEENCYLTTVGRRTGRPHEIEIWFGVVDGGLALISGNGPTADWFRNLVATPDVMVRVRGEERHGVARVVIDPAERRRIGEVMGAKYPWEGDPSIGLTFAAWCFEVPAVVVDDWSLPTSRPWAP